MNMENKGSESLPYERKYIPGNLDVKATADGEEEGKFSGVLSTYGNIDSYNDIVVRGAFDGSVAKKTKYPFLYQHDSWEPIGSFEVTGTADSLEIEGSFNLGVSRARDAYALLKRGDITGLSIGFVPTDYHYGEDGIRYLTEIDLMEGSLVTFPANTMASAEAKSMELKTTRAKLMSLPSIKALDRKEQKDIIDDLLDEILDEDEKFSEEDEEEESDKSSEEDEEEDIDALKTALEKMTATINALKEILNDDEEDKSDDEEDDDEKSQEDENDEEEEEEE